MCHLIDWFRLSLLNYKHLGKSLQTRLNKLFHRFCYSVKRNFLISRIAILKFLLSSRHLDYSLFPNCDVWYINLDSREDRNKQICEEFERFQVSGYKRFSAIYNSRGSLGCSLSHQSVIAKSRTSEVHATVVFEDDLIFIAPPRQVGRVVREFLENPGADVLCIANFTKDKPTYFSPNLRRTMDVQTMACYLFKPHMKKHLELAADLSIKQLNETHGASGILDKKWKILQKDFVFVIPKKKLAVQRSSFSDIINKQARYDF